MVRARPEAASCPGNVVVASTRPGNRTPGSPTPLRANHELAQSSALLTALLTRRTVSAACLAAVRASVAIVSSFGITLPVRAAASKAPSRIGAVTAVSVPFADSRAARAVSAVGPPAIRDNSLIVSCASRCRNALTTPRGSFFSASASNACSTGKSRSAAARLAGTSGCAVIAARSALTSSFAARRISWFARTSAVRPAKASTTAPPPLATIRATGGASNATPVPIAAPVAASSGDITAPVIAPGTAPPATRAVTRAAAGVVRVNPV